VQRLGLFDLDNTLLGRDAAFRGWLDEFVTNYRLDAAAHRLQQREIDANQY
jgi:FMN phosphatase YigB (HAD superfamily)